jgi:excisionase family DNA binding protein
MEKLLDSREAAAFLGINTKTLQRLSRSGELRGIKIGKLWRFRKEDLGRRSDPPKK